MVKTQNEGFGFHGTIARTTKEADRLFEKAARELIAYGMTEEEAVKLLDSTLGRHLADQIIGTSKNAAVCLVKNFANTARGRRQIAKVLSA